MADYTKPGAAPLFNVKTPQGTRDNRVLRPAVGAGSSALLETAEVVSTATTGLAPRIRPSALYVDGGFLYFVCFGNPWGFQVANLSNPDQPVIVGEVTASISPLPYKLRARTDLGSVWIVQSAGRALARYDVSDPTNPFLAATVDNGGQPFGFDITADASVAAVATTSTATGLRFVDLASMSVVGTLVDGNAYADAAVEGNTAYGSAFFQSSGAPHGSIRAVNIADPANPVLLGEITGLTGSSTSLRRLTVRDGIVYALARDIEGGGVLFVADFRDPGNPVLLRQLPCLNTTDSSGIQIVGNVMLTGRSGAGAAGRQLRVWSLLDPLNPFQARLYEFDDEEDRVIGFTASENGRVYIGNRMFAPDNRVFTARIF